MIGFYRNCGAASLRERVPPVKAEVRKQLNVRNHKTTSIRFGCIFSDPSVRAKPY